MTVLVLIDIVTNITSTSTIQILTVETDISISFESPSDGVTAQIEKRVQISSEGVTMPSKEIVHL